MTIEDRLIDTFATCRTAIRPSPALLERPVKGDHMYQRRNRVLVGVAAAVIIAVAAAVAASATSANRAAGPTRQSFVGQADAVCAASKAQVRALPAYQALRSPTFVGPPTPSDVRSYDAQLRAIDLHTIAELRTLATPAQDRATIDALLTQLAIPLGATTVFDETLIALGDYQLTTKVGAAAVAADSREKAQAAKAAHDYGLNQCDGLFYD